jgi:DNA-binding transcriptional LysR family regulator
MNIEDLQAFLSVADHASFSRAAEALHLTQPAVSKRIAALESQLDTRLFDRIGRQVSLTEAGRALREHARRIVTEIEDSRRAIQNLSGTVSGPLKLATSHHISLHRLPPVLHDYTRQYPQVELDLSFMDSEEACRAVEQGELELALVTLPPADASPLTLIKAWTDRLVLAASPEHPLSQAKKIDATTLAQHPAILPARGTYTRALIDQTLAVGQLEARLETHYLETIKMLVSVGLGWSLLPDTMLEESLRPSQGTDIQVERQLGIVHHPQRVLSNAARAFIEMCQG